MAVSPKQVKALLLNPTDDRLGVVLSWLLNTELDMDQYNLFRAGAILVSNSFATVALNDGDTLEVVIDGGPKQTVTFSNTYITSGAATAAEIVANLNAVLVGASASLSLTASPTAFVLRSNGPAKPASLEIKAGTTQALLGLPTGVFKNSGTFKNQKIGEVDELTNTFQDLDGRAEYQYFVEAETTAGLKSQRSVVKSLGYIADETPERIIIHGTIFDSSGKPLANEGVFLRPVQTKRPALNYKSLDFFFDSIKNAQHGISIKESVSFTDEDGYFEIEAVASTRLRLVIPCIEYDRHIKTGNQTQKFTELLLVNDDFSL